jgi:tetratricopeptide (TPR) repeat protein
MEPFASQNPRLTTVERERYALGRASFERGEVDQALEALSPLLESRRGFADLHYMIGVLLDHRGETDAATERLRDAIRLNPGYTEALLALGSVYERRGDFARSRELTEQAAAVARRDDGGLDATTRGKLANLQAAVGNAYAQVGELRDAIEAYRKALDHCPEFQDIRLRLGTALREAGLLHKAETEFQRILRSNAEFHEARVQLGVTYYTLGRTEDALAAWSTVLEHEPNREDAQMYLRMVRSSVVGDPAGS